MHNRPMPIKVFRELNPGDEFRVSWDKDDDPQYRRFHFDLQTVADNDGQLIFSQDGDEWDYSRCPDENQNLIDTSRGYAFFFFP